MHLHAVGKYQYDNHKEVHTFVRFCYANETTVCKCCLTVRNDMPPCGWFNTWVIVDLAYHRIEHISVCSDDTSDDYLLVQDISFFLSWKKTVHLSIDT